MKHFTLLAIASLLMFVSCDKETSSFVNIPVNYQTYFRVSGIITEDLSHTGTDAAMKEFNDFSAIHTRTYTVPKAKTIDEACQIADQEMASILAQDLKDAEALLETVKNKIASGKGYGDAHFKLTGVYLRQERLIGENQSLYSKQFADLEYKGDI